MSLLDAFLLDPARINIWLAIRSDSALGSGTQQDPYHAGFIATYLPFTVSSITFSAGTATVTTATNHGFANNQRIVIYGVTGSNASFYNGVFSITVTAATTFTFGITVGTPSSVGTGPKCQRNPFLFDEVMRSIPANPKVRVYLGPGVYQTLGYHANLAGGWQIQAGMQLLGSGVDVSILQLVGLTAQAQNVYAIGHDLVTGTNPNLKDQVEIRDLTLDCNPGAAGVDPSCAFGGARVMGNHSRITRVKLINWKNSNANLRGYGLAMITGNMNVATSAQVLGVRNCGLQECIAVDPNSGCTERYVAFHVGGPEAGGAVQAVGVGPYLRDCYADGSIAGVADFTKKLQGLSMDWCTAGVVEGNQVANLTFGGPFMQEESSSPNNYGAGSLLVRGNAYRNVAIGMAWQLGSSTPTNPGVRNLVLEENTIELATASSLNTFLVGGSNVGVYGIVIDDRTAAVKPYGTVVIQRNLIRYLDGAASGFGNGVLALGVTNINMSQNILENLPINPLQNNRCGGVTYFSNRTSPGILIRGLNQATSTLYSELETDVEDALILAYWSNK